MTPNRVTRGHWPTKENRQNLYIFCIFPGPWRKWPGMAPNGARRIFGPTNPDLADILGKTDLDFENFDFSYFLDPKFLDFQVPRFPDAAASAAAAD